MTQKFIVFSAFVLLLSAVSAQAQSQKQIKLGGGLVLNTKIYTQPDNTNLQRALPVAKRTPLTAKGLGLPKPLPQNTAPAGAPKLTPFPKYKLQQPNPDFLAQHAKQQVLKALNPARHIHFQMPSVYKSISLQQVSQFAQENAKTFKNIVKKRKQNETLTDEEVGVWVMFEKMRAAVSANNRAVSFKAMGLPRAALKRAGISAREIDGKTRAAFEKEANRRMQENQQIHDYNVTVNPVLD